MADYRRIVAVSQRGEAVLYSDSITPMRVAPAKGECDELQTETPEER